MKRFRIGLALSLVILLAAGFVQAREVSFGAKAGVTLSTLSQNPTPWEDDLSFHSGLAGGAFLIYAFNERFSLQPELLYVQKGVSANLYDGFIPVDLSASFDYVELPILARYTFPLKGGFKPHVFAGPSLAYLLNAELELSASFLTAQVDFSSLTHVNDVGAVIGGGFAMPAGDGILTFDVRYDLGFSNVILTGDFEFNGSTQTIEADGIKNQGLAFMVGYIF